MNTANLKKTRDYLAEHPDQYDQANWMRPCGTPSCVAGYAVAVCGGTLLDEERCLTSDGDNWYLPVYAQELLGLDFDQREDMFSAAPYDSFEPVTATEALAMLDWAIDRDEVRWPPRRTEDTQT